jgi:hypothetical protein
MDLSQSYNDRIMIKPASRILTSLVMLWAVAACDDNPASFDLNVNLSEFTQSRTLLPGRWVLTKRCGEMDCISYSHQASPEVVVITPNDTVRFYHEGALWLEQSYYIVGEAFANHHFGLTSGLGIQGYPTAEFGVNGSRLYLSTAYLDGPSDWYERLRDTFP